MRYVTSEEMREIDRQAIYELGIAGVLLMENAGKAVFAEVMKQLEEAQNKFVCVVCGKGNNGGDGYVIARHLLDHGKEIKVLLVGTKDDIKGDARINFDKLHNMNVQIQEIKDEGDIAILKDAAASSDIVVDAILGTGTRGEIKGLAREAIDVINDAAKSVIAVDIPSGLDTDTGEVLGTCIRAKKTVTFALPKKGFKNPAAQEYIGELIIADIGIPYQLLK
ncbi:MAG: NAD(P)H-hydrate epimerase [bacterium]